MDSLYDILTLNSRARVVTQKVPVTCGEELIVWLQGNGWKFTFLLDGSASGNHVPLLSFPHTYADL